MIKICEVIGRGLDIEVTDLIWHWLNGLTENLSGQIYRDCEEVLRLLKKKQFDHALGISAAELNKAEMPFYRIVMADVFLHNYETEKALAQLKLVCEEHPNLTFPLYLVGYCYEMLGKEKKAIAYYQDCLKFKNFLQLPHQRIAAISLKNGQIEKAAQQYEILASEYPDDLTSCILLGYLYLEMKDFKKAVDTFNKAILIHPDNFYNNDQEIENLLNDGDYYQALEVINQLIFEYESRPELLLKKAEILQKMGCESESVHLLENCVQKNPHYLEGCIKLGAAYMENGERMEAAKCFNQALEINDCIVDAYIGLALAENSVGNEKKALDTLKLASAIAPNSSILFTETAKIYFEGVDSPRYEEYSHQTTVDSVIEAHKFEVSERPQNPFIHYRLGILYMCLKRCMDAARSFRNAMEINSDFYRARIKLMLCHIQSGDFDAAINYLYKESYINYGLYYKTAVMYCNKVKFAACLLNLEKSMIDNYTLPAATFNMSIVLQNLGLMDRSEAMWDNIQETLEFSRK